MTRVEPDLTSSVCVSNTVIMSDQTLPKMPFKCDERRGYSSKLVGPLENSHLHVRDGERPRMEPIKNVVAVHIFFSFERLDISFPSVFMLKRYCVDIAVRIFDSTLSNDNPPALIKDGIHFQC